MNDNLHFQYFDSDTKEWKRLDQFPTPPYLASIVAVGRNIYAVGSYHNSTDFDDGDNTRASNNLYIFDAETSKWEELPSMLHVHEVEFSRLVYAGGFIYIVGDFSHAQVVQRFHIEENKWEMLPESPIGEEQTMWSVPVAYQSILLFNFLSWRYEGGVEGIPQRVCIHKILEYNPTTNAWQTVLMEEIENLEIVHLAPALFEFQGNIYRVLYKRPDRANREGILPLDYNRQLKPIVHVLKLQSLRNGMRVSVGEEVNQDWIPINRIGAFRIQDDVFINASGFVYQTDMKIGADQTSDVDLQAWESFALKWNALTSIGVLENSNVMYFTFDKNKFGDR